MRFVTLENAPKNWPKSFFHWQVCLFFFQKLKFWSQQPLRCCRNDPKSSAAIRICQNTLWTRVNRSLRFVTPDNAKKYRPKSFLHRKECIFFFEKLCFQQPLRYYRNDLVTSTVIVRSPCGLLWINYWGLPHSMNREKIQQTLFFTGTFAFFSKICVFNNFLGVTELFP